MFISSHFSTKCCWTVIEWANKDWLFKSETAIKTRSDNAILERWGTDSILRPSSIPKRKFQLNFQNSGFTGFKWLNVIIDIKLGTRGFQRQNLTRAFSGVCSIRNCFTCTTQCNLHKTLIKETKFSRNIVIMFGDNIPPLILESRKWNKLLIRKITESLPYVRITTFSGAFSKRFRHASDKRYNDILVPVISKLGGDSIDPKYLKFF